jgi:hypothetical protein
MGMGSDELERDRVGQLWVMSVVFDPFAGSLLPL